MSLQSQEWQVCSVTVGVLGDISRALEDAIYPYCDGIMQTLLQNLQSEDVQRTIKPMILAGPKPSALEHCFITTLAFLLPKFFIPPSSLPWRGGGRTGKSASSYASSVPHFGMIVAAALRIDIPHSILTLPFFSAKPTLTPLCTSSREYAQAEGSRATCIFCILMSTHEK